MSPSIARGSISFGPIVLLPDIVILRDAANILAQRNGTTPQALRIYNTFTSSTVYEAGFVGWSGNVFIVGAEAGSGGGSSRDLILKTPSDNIRCTNAGLNDQINLNAGRGRFGQTTSAISCEIDGYSSQFNLGSDVKIQWGTSNAYNATKDTKLFRSAAGALGLEVHANAAELHITSLTELLTIASAATTDTAIQFPANSLALGVSVRVTVAIPTAATFDVGIAGATTRYGTGIAVATNTTNASVGTTNPNIYAAATSVRITPNLTPGDTTGRLRVTLHYIDLSAPTS